MKDRTEQEKVEFLRLELPPLLPFDGKVITNVLGKEGLKRGPNIQKAPGVLF